MTRRTLVLACGVAAACGDSSHPLGASGVADARGDAPADARADSSLILHYDFEDTSTTVTDRSVRGKHASLSDVSAWTAGGRVGRGVALTGGIPPARFVTLPDGVLTGVEDFTIAVWVKANTVSNWARVYDFGNAAPAPPLYGTAWMFLTLHGYAGAGDDGVHASSYDGSADNEIIAASSTQFPTGVWKHLAVTGSGGNRTLYIDGFPAATTATTRVAPPGDMEPVGGHSWLGRSRFEDKGDVGLDATLDEFRIYDRALAAPEIADLAWPQRDYAYWRFDEMSGLVAADSSDRAIATALNTGLGWTTGRLGGALEFPGGPVGADGPHALLASSPLAGCTTQLTVATWVKLHSQDSWARVFDFGSATASFIYLTLYDDQPGGAHGMHFAMVSPNGAFDAATPTPPVPADEAWHHVAVTVDPAATVTMYVDGAVVLTTVNTMGVKVSDFAATTENYLGKSRFEATDVYLHAALDDLRIACRAFTADEIKSLSRP